MIKNIEEQKARITKEITDTLAKYYGVFEAGTNQEGFDINKIERLMIDNQRRIKKVMEEANSELVSNIDVEAKKNALIV